MQKIKEKYIKCAYITIFCIAKITMVDVYLATREIIIQYLLYISVPLVYGRMDYKFISGKWVPGMTAKKKKK